MNEQSNRRDVNFKKYIEEPFRKRVYFASAIRYLRECYSPEAEKQFQKSFEYMLENLLDHRAAKARCAFEVVKKYGDNSIVRQNILPMFKNSSAFFEEELEYAKTRIATLKEVEEFSNDPKGLPSNDEVANYLKERLDVADKRKCNRKQAELENSVAHMEHHYVACFKLKWDMLKIEVYAKENGFTFLPFLRGIKSYAEISKGIAGNKIDRFLGHRKYEANLKKIYLSGFSNLLKATSGKEVVDALKKIPDFKLEKLNNPDFLRHIVGLKQDDIEGRRRLINEIFSKLKQADAYENQQNEEKKKAMKISKLHASIEIVQRLAASGLTQSEFLKKNPDIKLSILRESLAIVRELSPDTIVQYDKRVEAEKARNYRGLLDIAENIVARINTIEDYSFLDFELDRREWPDGVTVHSIIKLVNESRNLSNEFRKKGLIKLHNWNEQIRIPVNTELFLTRFISFKGYTPTREEKEKTLVEISKLGLLKSSLLCNQALRRYTETGSLLRQPNNSLENTHDKTLLKKQL